MGAARYWDDPEADLEETVDLPLPASLRARLDGEAPPAALRILREVIDAIRLVGGVLIIGGLIVIFTAKASGRDFVRIALPVTSLAVIPGALYLVAAEGLVRRRYWAWVMSLLVTIVLMIAILAAGYYFVAVVARRGAGPGGDVNAGGLFFPIALYFSMPSLILIYMLRALPVIREAELLTFKGFNVLPPAPVQPLVPSQDTPRPSAPPQPEPPA